MYSPCFARLSGSASPPVPVWSLYHHPECPAAVTFNNTMKWDARHNKKVVQKKLQSRTDTTNSPLGQPLSWHQTLWPPCCWSLFKIYHDTDKSNTNISKEMFTWLSDLCTSSPLTCPVCLRLSAAPGCIFAAEALVLLCGRQNNMERCCRLKRSGSSPQSKMPSCWLGHIRCRTFIHRAGD